VQSFRYYKSFADIVLFKFFYVFRNNLRFHAVFDQISTIMVNKVDEICLDHILQRDAIAKSSMCYRNSVHLSARLSVCMSHPHIAAKHLKMKQYGGR